MPEVDQKVDSNQGALTAQDPASCLEEKGAEEVLHPALVLWNAIERSL